MLSPDSDNKQPFNAAAVHETITERTRENTMKELSVTVPSPDIDITINNNTLANLTERLMTLTLTDNRAFEADRVTLTLDDTDGQLQLPPRGARLRVMIGWRGESLVNKGTYVVDEVAWEGPPDKLIITASSADFREEFNVRREVSPARRDRKTGCVSHRSPLRPEDTDKRNPHGYRN